VTPYHFPGFPAFLEAAAAEEGRPEAAGPSRRNATLAAVATLCGQAAEADGPHVASILAKAEEMAAPVAGRLPRLREDAGRCPGRPHPSGTGDHRSSPPAEPREPMPDLTYATDEDLALRAPARLPPALPPRPDGRLGDRRGVRRWGSLDLAFELGGLRGRRGRPGPDRSDPRALAAIPAPGRGPGGTRRGRPLARPEAQGSARRRAAPRAPPGGLTGVEFLIVTLAPQIEGASRDLDRGSGSPRGPAARSTRERSATPWSSRSCTASTSP
jgi:hypothetical protein